MLFRGLIWWALLIISSVVGAVSERYFLPAELVSYLDSLAAAKRTVFDWISLAAFFVVLIAFVIASVGLYKFKRWGRTLLLWTNVVFVIISPVFGVSVVSALASPLYSLESLLMGGIIFAMYLPPIGPLFEDDVVSPKATNL